MRSVGRLTAVVGVAASIAAACSGVTDGSGATAGGGPATAAADGCPAGQALHAGSRDVAEAPADEDAEFPFLTPDPVVAEGFDFDAIISGGPPPDGIPSIDAPCFESVDAASEWLEPQSPLLAIEVDGDVRGYPLAIMTQHEIVNDVIADVPVVVTYCPLCNSGLAFEREVDGQVLDFGTSGMLYRANLVMYDRQTRNLWIQFTGRAVAGEPWVGTELERIPTAVVSFEEFGQAAPGGSVLSRDTGHDRRYGSNPYPGYEGRGSTFLFDGPTDDRLDPDSRVVGLVSEDADDAVAVPLDVLREERVVEVEVGGRPVTVWWAPGAASALDAGTVASGGDVGQTGAFRPLEVGGQPLTFRPQDDERATFEDEQTLSTWNVLGAAIGGPLEGRQLEPVSRDDTFWFVWFAFRPETRIADPA